MARIFSLNTVFRMSDRSLLREFFTRMEAEHLDEVPWDKMGRREIKPLFTEMTPDRQIYAEMALRNIHAMVCDKGMESLAIGSGT